jgi:diaminohydroxyphosphoribosylaminopyrimidine deaminase/5-amino-6-(5-phosphoribosylamino)uracil reductase
MTSRFDRNNIPDEARDAAFMAAAVTYGRRGLGVTAPNPAVGCVIVKDGVIIARGYTQPGGRPHAETEALRMAGEAARGATLYVSLEPCSHFGVTGPCAHAIVQSGVARVVSAIEDPDIRVAGRGHAMIVEAGIGLRVGVGASAARRANLGHIMRVTEGRPMVTLKLAQTSNGFAGVPGQRLLITDEAANGRVQMMRAMHDAVMVGIGTVLADDPQLTVRLAGLEQRKPLRVVLDSALRLPLGTKLVQSAKDHPTLVICAEDAAVERQSALEAQGVQVARVARDAKGHLDLKAALKLLGQRGITRVLSEGGPTLGAALIEQGLAEKVVIFTSPRSYDGQGGLAALRADTRALLSQSNWRMSAEGHAGRDSFVQYERMI